MADYYGVIRSEKHIKHYGVKGMRWGVRKAIERGDNKALARHYRKAQKKLLRLEERVDVNKQKKLYEERKNDAISTAIGGVVGSGMMAGFNHLSKNAAIRRANNMAMKNGGFGYAKYHNFVIPVFAGATATDAVINGIAAKVAKNRTTKEGHAKAVKDVNDWKHEMNQAFKGTAYAKKASGIDNEKYDVRNPADHERIARRDRGSSDLSTVFLRTEKIGKLSSSQSHIIDPNMCKRAETYSKHYNYGIDHGMDPDGASSYANGRLSSSTRKRRR